MQILVRLHLYPVIFRKKIPFRMLRLKFKMINEISKESWEWNVLKKFLITL